MLLLMSLLVSAADLPVISEAFWRAQVQFLASDELEGRLPATRADALTQRYLATQFAALGLAPGAPDGTFFQAVPLVGIEGHPETLAFKAKGGSKTLAYRDEFMAVAGCAQATSQVEAELVFVGYGIHAPEFQWNDFKDADLRGKVLLIMNNDPASDPALFQGPTRLRYGRWDYKFEMAEKTGASGAIIIHTPVSAGYPWSVIRTSWAGEQFDLPGPRASTFQMKAWTSEEATRALVALGGFELDALRATAESRTFAPVRLGVTVSARFTSRVQQKTSANVIAKRAGAIDELVIFTAHHDHLGTNPRADANEDGIYNGAVDNASGVAALLSIARAFAEQAKAPKRTVIFAAVAAEEQGLLGSRYLAEHPPVPPGRIAANINMDSENVFGRTRDVEAIGLGKSSLDEVLRACAKKQGRTVVGDQQPDKGSFYRSDQYNFARIGVPAAYFGSGLDYRDRPAGWGKAQVQAYTAQHYHQPSDRYDQAWDVSGALEDAQLSYCVGASVANAAQLPVWVEGDEFEAARRAAVR